MFEFQKEEVVKKGEERKSQARNEQRQKTIQRVKEYMEVCIVPLVPPPPSPPAVRFMKRYFVAEEPCCGEAAAPSLPEAFTKTGRVQGTQVSPICSAPCPTPPAQKQLSS